MEIVSATVALAPRLAYLINLAGEGLPEYLWSGMAEADESPLDVGSRRAARKHRGRGVARALMADAAGRARAAGCEVMSLIVASGNAAALGLYDAIGYQVARTLPVVPYPGCPHGGEWVLMTHRLSSEPR